MAVLTAMALLLFGLSLTFAVTVGNDTVDFIEVRYDYPSTGQSTWYYSVESGASPSISHVNFKFGTCIDADNILDSGTWGPTNNDLQSGAGSPVFGPDNSTTGDVVLKFDQGFNDNESRNYYFTLDGNYAQDDMVTIVSKGGPGFDSAFITGPSLDCDEVDNEPPVVECPADIVVTADPQATGKVVSWTEPTPTDNVGIQSIVRTDNGPANGAEFPIGTTTITYLVTDTSGNTTECSFDVTVNETPTYELRMIKYNDLNQNGENDEINTGAGDPQSGNALLDWEFVVYDSQGNEVGRNTTSVENAGANGDLGIRASIPGLISGEEYTICETQQDGWINTQPGTIDPTYGEPCETVTLTSSTNATRYFGNYEEAPETGSITIRKNVDDDSFADMMFDFTFDGTEFSLSENGAAYVVTDLSAGTYTVLEDVPEGWDLTTISCNSPNNNTGATDGLNIVLEEGEDEDCTFNNVKLPEPETGTIAIEKVTTNNDTTTPFMFNPTGFNGDQSFNLVGGGQQSFTVEVGSGYGIEEVIPADWNLDSATCDDGSIVVNIDVSADEMVTCTFTNEFTPPPPPEDLRLNLTAECAVGDTLYWRVTNDEDVDIPFTVRNKGINGVATANSRTYFTTQDAGGANTTIIDWDNPSGNADSKTKAHNNQPCVYHVTFEKEWTGADAPDLDGATLLTAESSLGTATCTSDDGALSCVYSTGDDLQVPFGETYTVNESGVDGWTVVEGTGSGFTGIAGFDESALPDALVYDVAQDRFCESNPNADFPFNLEKFCEHTVVNEQEEPPVTLERLIPDCKDVVNDQFRWRVRNPNDEPIEFTLTNPAGDVVFASGTAAPNGDTVVYTDVSETTFPTILRVDGVEQPSGRKNPNVNPCTGSIEIKKVVTVAEGSEQPPADAEFTFTVTGDDYEQTFTLKDGESKTLSVVAGLPYSVEETITVNGDRWTTTNSCEGSLTAPIWGSEDCTFTNEYDFKDMVCDPEDLNAMEDLRVDRFELDNGKWVGKVTNTSEVCEYRIGLASYEMYDDPSELRNQVLFDSNPEIPAEEENWPEQGDPAFDGDNTVGPGEMLEIHVDVPECAFQVDLVFDASHNDRFTDGDVDSVPIILPEFGRRDLYGDLAVAYNVIGEPPRLLAATRQGNELCVGETPVITDFTLINADADTAIDGFDPIQPDAEYDSTAPDTPERFSIIVKNYNEGVGSVYMELTGPVSFSRTENRAPFALFGDDNNGNFYGEGLPAGFYTMTATPYGGVNGTGEAGATITVNFMVNDGTIVIVEPEPEPQPEPVDETPDDEVSVELAAVESFTLVDASNGTDAAQLSGSVQMSMNEMPSLINVRANTTGTVGSVLFEVSGSATMSKTENIAPYALLGDDATNPGIVPAPGTFTIKATPFSEANLGGSAGTPMEFTITITPVELVVERFILVNAENSQPMMEIKDNAVIDISTFSNKVNIVAEVNLPGETASVSFVVGGDINFSRTDSGEPFAILGDGNGVYLAPGSFTLSATPNGTGSVVSTPLNISLTVVDGGAAAASAPTVEEAEADAPFIEGAS